MIGGLVYKLNPGLEYKAIPFIISSRQNCINNEIASRSCLGPLLYTIYASEPFNVIKAHLSSVYSYADDTQLYIFFSPNENRPYVPHGAKRIGEGEANEDKGDLEAVKAMKLCVKDIRSWMSKDINSISVGTQDISPADAPIKNLRIWLDSNLSMDSHITTTCSAAFYYLYNIRRIRRYLSRDATETLVHAFIASRLD